MAPCGAETRGTLLLASKNYEKWKARGHEDDGFPYRVEQAIKSGLISVDDDFAKMCLTDERRSVLGRQVTKGLGRQMKKQRRKQRNQASSARLAIQPQPPLTGVQAMVQPQLLSEHPTGDQVTVPPPQHLAGIRPQSLLRSIWLEFRSQSSRSISRSQSSRSLSLEFRSQSCRSLLRSLTRSFTRSLLSTFSTPSSHSTLRKDTTEEIVRVMVAIILITGLKQLTASTLPRPSRRRALCRNGESQE